MGNNPPTHPLNHVIHYKKKSLDFISNSFPSLIPSPHRCSQANPLVFPTGSLYIIFVSFIFHFLFDTRKNHRSCTSTTSSSPMGSPENSTSNYQVFGSFCRRDQVPNTNRYNSIDSYNPSNNTGVMLPQSLAYLKTMS